MCSTIVRVIFFFHPVVDGEKKKPAPLEHDGKKKYTIISTKWRDKQDMHIYIYVCTRNKWVKRARGEPAAATGFVIIIFFFLIKNPPRNKCGKNGGDETKRNGSSDGSDLRGIRPIMHDDDDDNNNKRNVGASPRGGKKKREKNAGKGKKNVKKKPPRACARGRSTVRGACANVSKAQRVLSVPGTPLSRLLRRGLVAARAVECVYCRKRFFFFFYAHFLSGISPLSVGCGVTSPYLLLFFFSANIFSPFLHFTRRACANGFFFTRRIPSRPAYPKPRSLSPSRSSPRTVRRRVVHRTRHTSFAYTYITS